MRLDADTLLIVNVANLLVLASTLPAIMGQRLSPAASAARRSLVVQGVGWVALILSGLWPETRIDQLLSTFSMTCISLSHWLWFQAFKAWLGPRPFEKFLIVILLLMPIGYGLTFSSYPLRVGWANLLIALQLLLLARAALRPASAAGGSWRWVMFGCFVLMRRSDEALYCAKAQGRARLILTDSISFVLDQTHSRKPNPAVASLPTMKLVHWRCFAALGDKRRRQLHMCGSNPVRHFYSIF